MGALRDRMEADLRLRRRSQQTIDSYLGCARRFVEFHRRPPAEMGRDDVIHYFDHLVQERRVSASTQVVYLAALRFLFAETLGRPEVVAGLPRPTVRSRLPSILSRDELERLFAVTSYPKHRAAFLAGYSAGLRIGEVVALQIEDVDSRRGVLWVRRGKGDKDRQTLLSAQLLAELRTCWRLCRPPGSHLFFSPSRPGQPMHTRSLDRALHQALSRAEITRPGLSFHSLRHSFATHLLEDGVSLRVIQELLGHERVETTARYVRVSRSQFEGVRSPAEGLRLGVG